MAIIGNPTRKTNISTALTGVGKKDAFPANHRIKPNLKWVSQSAVCRFWMTSLLLLEKSLNSLARQSRLEQVWEPFSSNPPNSFYP
jgi:hypothetical protein